MTIIERANRSIGLSRREVLSALATGLGLASLYRGKSEGLALNAISLPPKKATFPKGAIIRTVLKDLSPDEFEPGAVLVHEHVASDRIDELVIEELTAARKAGVSGVVCVRGSGARPNVENFRTISTRTNIHIVAASGYYNQKTYTPDIATKSEDEIADDLVQEAHRSGLGAFGEMAQAPNTATLSPEEVKVFHAVGKAHLRTNLPIITHNAYGTGPNVPPEAGLLQLDALESVGVKPQHVVVGHSCCLDDPKAEILKQIAKRGAFIGFDRMADQHVNFPPGAPVRPYGEEQFPEVHDIPDDQRVAEVLELLNAGYENQLLFADDPTTQPLHVSAEIGEMVKDKYMTEDNAEKIKTILYNSMGLGRAVTAFVPKLRKAGVKEETLRTILHDNPLRFLAFEPKAS